MKKCFHIFFFLEILVISASSTSAQKPFILTDFEHSLSKHKMDEIKGELINDDIPNEILFFNSNFLNKNAIGCKIIMNANSMKMSQILINLKNFSEKKVTHKIYKSHIGFFRHFFSHPNIYIDDSLLLSHKELSHDNVIYLFVKINDKLFFDQYFLRSYFLGTQNANSFKLILKLQEVCN